MDRPEPTALPRQLGTTRARLAWWLFVAALGGLVLFVLYAFVGTFTLGVFLYYAARPAYRRVRTLIPSDGVAAMTTLLLAAVPILLLLAYTAVTALLDLVDATGVGTDDVVDLIGRFVIGRELTGSGEDILLSLVQNPGQIDQVSTGLIAGLVGGGLQTFGAVAGVLVHVGLAFTLAFTLLRDGEELASWVRTNVAGDDSTFAAYGSAVDDDLQTVYFGNVLFVVAMAILAAITYNGFNLLAPAGLTIPTPTLLAVLTGIASLIPLIVGKVVYFPIVAYLAFQAAGSDAVGFAPPIALFVFSFAFLDFLPQTFLQPYLAGRTLSTELMIFAYILGPLLFGWYGFFLLPLVVVLVVQAARIVLVELIHGDRLTTAVNSAESMGADPDAADDQPIPDAAIDHEVADSDDGAGGPDESEADSDPTGGDGEGDADGTDDRSA